MTTHNMLSKRNKKNISTFGLTYEGPAKSSVTNRLPKFYPRYILKCFSALEWCVK